MSRLPDGTVLGRHTVIVQWISALRDLLWDVSGDAPLT